MNRSLYKGSFKNVNVSEQVLNDVIARTEPGQKMKLRKHRYLKILLPAAAVLSASFITVSAAVPQLGLSDVFRSFYNQFFGISVNSSQMDVVEKYGSVPDADFYKDGIKLEFQGVLGNSDTVYLKYSVAVENEFDPDTLSAVLSSDLIIGDLKDRIRPAAVSSRYDTDSLDQKKQNYSVIYEFNKGLPIAGKKATFIMRSPHKYIPVQADLQNIYREHAGDITIENGIYSLPDGELNIPIKAQSGTFLLNSIGYKDEKLMLLIDSAGYYNSPKLCLKDTVTGRLYYRLESYGFSGTETAGYYSFNIGDINLLKNLEIVMPEEYHISFPLDYVDNTRTVTLSSPVSFPSADTDIRQIKISPVSVAVSGSSASGTPLYNCSVRLKDKTVLNNLKFFSSSYSGGHECSYKNVYTFDGPIESGSVEAVIFSTIFKTVEISVN